MGGGKNQEYGWDNYSWKSRGKGSSNNDYRWSYTRKFVGTCSMCGKYGHQWDIGRSKQRQWALRRRRRNPSAALGYYVVPGPHSSVVATTSVQNSHLAKNWACSVVEVSAMNNNHGQMMDIVVVSGSMSEPCPPWFAGDLAIEESQKVQLVDIQKQTNKSYGRRRIALFIAGYGEEV